MTQKVFLDTNVILDFLLLRLPYTEEAKRIFYMKEEGEIEVYASALSFGIASYYIEKSKQNSSMFMVKFLKLVEVIDLTREVIEKASVSNFSDFEDALQYYSARMIPDIDVLITRNKKDFKNSTIQVATPTEFIESFTQ